MSHQVELKQAEPILTAVIRGRVAASELPKFIPAACGEVWAFARSSGLKKPGRHVALYLADGSVEVGAEVTEPFTGNERVVCSKLPAGRVATAVHFGPYGQLGKAHAAVSDWCREQGHKRTNICWEIYGHWEESWNHDASKIRTDVFHLLE